MSALLRDPSASKRVFRTVAEVDAVRAVCPDFVPTWDHFKPANALINALNSAVTAAVLIVGEVATKQLAALKASDAADEAEAERLSEESDSALANAKARAPAALAYAVLRDIAIKSTQRLVEFSLFFFSDISTHMLRNLTTSLSKELARVDGKPKAEKPGVFSIVITALVSGSIGRLSVVAVDTIVDVYRSLLAGGDSKRSKEERAVARSQVLARFRRRQLLSSGTSLLSAALVGLGYLVATSANVSSSNVCSIATLVGENILYIAL